MRWRDTTVRMRRSPTDSSSPGGDAQGRAQGGDDRSADRDRQQRPGGAGVEELAPQPGEDDQFASHHRDGGADRGDVAGDEERKGVEDPPAKVPPPVIAPRSTGLPRPVRSPVSDRPSEKAMLTPAPRAVATPAKNAVRGRCVASATAKMGAAPGSTMSRPSARSAPAAPA